MLNQKTAKRIRRHKRVRAKISGTAQRPRISVFKSNIALRVQVIDDKEAVTILSGDTDSKKGTKVEQAKELGQRLAKEMQAKKITEAVFDRGGNLYTGRIKALAESLREGGIKI